MATGIAQKTPSTQRADHGAPHRHHAVAAGLHDRSRRRRRRDRLRMNCTVGATGGGNGNPAAGGAATATGVPAARRRPREHRPARSLPAARRPPADAPSAPAASRPSPAGARNTCPHFQQRFTAPSNSSPQWAQRTVIGIPCSMPDSLSGHGLPINLKSSRLGRSGSFNELMPRPRRQRALRRTARYASASLLARSVAFAAACNSAR